MASAGEFMMQLYEILKEEQSHRNVTFEIIQQDYFLSWVLFGIAHTEELNKTLAFKGGTALKKIYFGNYRFSQDLDFTALKGAPKGDHLEKAIGIACQITQKEMQKIDSRIEVIWSRYPEKSPHPQGQEAFVIRCKLPWHNKQFLTTAKVEITLNQNVVHAPLLKEIMHNYPEELHAQILTYSLNEIFGEKLIAIYKNTIKLHETGWARSRARDYYDLWQLLNFFREDLDQQKIMQTAMYKFAQPLSFNGVEDFFDPAMLRRVQDDWDHWIGTLVHPAPAHETVLRELKAELQNFLLF